MRSNFKDFVVRATPDIVDVYGFLLRSKERDRFCYGSPSKPASGALRDLCRRLHNAGYVFLVQEKIEIFQYNYIMIRSSTQLPHELKEELITICFNHKESNRTPVSAE